jgi:hypothetical protein
VVPLNTDVALVVGANTAAATAVAAVAAEAAATVGLQLLLYPLRLLWLEVAFPEDRRG